ncbi:MAG: flavodoxin-dependent (E)-4-hydroxy-3-methylbut-2-enyl-diphosphate synthase, partial [Oscillospiraceae bacterium]|nr:flavodoxin-dependent (E)-4-hydroxy-3-methylbut-2-enyl-diphosphate synthase [Oscillospiraceae bacterium]
MKERFVNVGGVKIGGGNPVTVQSMTNTDTRDIEATVGQIKRLEEAGCEIVRLAVPDAEAAEAVGRIKKMTNIPIVADIHFDYRLALECMRGGVDKIRINPGNIGDRDKVKAVADMAKASGVPIRIGVNGGSLEKDILEKHGHATADAMIESAVRHIEILDDCNFFDTVVSLKASDVSKTIEVYRKFSKMTDIPLHLGVTEAGTMRGGLLKSAIGIGSLLNDGIGDTIRVSLTADPVEEVRAAKDILKILGIRKSGVSLVSCPTCGRCRISLINIANEVEKRLENVNKDIKVAVMGCAVNGPGEAKEADIG